MLDDESPTSTNLGNDHEFIIKEYSLYWFEVFWGNPKQSHMRAYAQSGQYHTIVESRVQSGQYHTIVESRVRLTWYKSHALNLVVPIDW